MTQLELPEIPPLSQTRRMTFTDFHAANPGVYEALRDMALRLHRKGRKAGVKTLYEALRWRGIDTHGDEYKLNNNFTADYARLLMEHEPELAGFFETRERRTG